MKKIRTETLLIIIIPIALGFVAGVLGYLFVGVSGNQLPFFGQISLGNGGNNNQIVIDQPRSVVVEQDVQLRQVENDVWPTLFDIYYFKQSANPLTRAYLSTDILGEGVVITADGWLMSVAGAVPSLSGNYEIVGYQAKKYQVSKFIEDKITGVVFGKAEAQNLPVAKLGTVNNLRVGQTLALVSKNNGLKLVHIKKIGYQFKAAQDLIISSEELNKEIVLDYDLGKEIDGQALVNLKGEIVGLINGGRVIPVDYFKGLVNSVLEGRAISRPALGLKYLDLAQVDGLIDWGSKGALVYGNPARSSPAFGKILDGDIIKKIDDVEINANQGLAELISGYKTGDKPEFLIQRDQEEIRVEVELK